jgi:hypothetical protein
MRGDDIQIRKALAYASGTADRTGAIIDMANCEWILAIVSCGAVHNSAIYSIKMQQDDAVGGGTMADLLGTGITIAGDDDDQVFAILLIKPRKRYVRLYVDKDTSNACAESAIYILGGGRSLPALANITDELTVERHESPAEGTA